jgi:hypothetical protein
MRAVCIARHRFLSEHIVSIFGAIDIVSTPAVGFDEGMRKARAELPDLVICDYDLLVSAPLAEWERDEWLGVIPIIAVSLTRRPEEAHLMDTNGIAGFLYLPTIDQDAVARIVHAATMRRIRPPVDALRWTIEPSPIEHRAD